MASLAGPVILAEIGWVSMGLVDTIIVGPLGPDAIGATGIGSVLFLAVAIFGMGLLLGLDTLVSHAFGARRLDECRHWLVQGLWLSLLLAPPLTALALIGLALLPAWGFTDAVLDLLRPYLFVVTWSLLPLLFYAASRRYLQALGLVRSVGIAVVTGNVINGVADWALVYGRLGAPVMGVTGAAWATLCSRVYVTAFLLVAVAIDMRRRGAVSRRVAWRPRWRSLSRLVTLGLPAALQVTLELGVFAMASALAGRLDSVSLASHQIAVNLASLTFMVPLGLASAGAVRVGHAVGRRDAKGAARSGWTALLLGSLFMGSAAVAFVGIPRALVGIFSSNAAILGLTSHLLVVAAMFQLFDGLQGVSTGILRGLGDTRTPMVANLAGHWLLGLPVGYALCFWYGWGVIGLWVGLSAGLMVVGVVLVTTWRRRVAVLAW